jgi:hypothetical protein
MRRRLLQFVLAIAVVALPLVTAVTPAHADNASSLLALVNSLRASHGVGPLYADPTLTRVAQGWSAHMAAAATLSHNPGVGAQLSGGWTKLGENVGAGGSIPIVFNAFVNSPFHFGNMIDPTYNLTGIGVTVGAKGTLWVTQDFEAKPGATPVTATPATTAPPAHPAVTAPPVPHTVATTAPTTIPAVTTPPVAATVPPAVTAAPPTAAGTVLLPLPTTPGPLAAPAPIAAHHHAASVTGLILALALTGIASVVGGAWFVNKGLRHH